MKSLSSKLWVIIICACLSFNSYAQCDLGSLIIELKSVSPTGENCTANVTISFTIEKNNGNKYTYVHLWKPSDYPNYDYKKAPDKSDLGAVLATVAIHTDGTASLLPTYGPDKNVSTLYSGLVLAEESLGGKLYRITVSNMLIQVPGACSGLTYLKGDVWSTQSEANNHPPVHCVATALPVKLAKFKGDLLDNVISLSWMTTEEAGSNYFDVERSGDLVEFITLGSIKSKGTTTVNQNYSFIDRSPLQGNNYYRLKMVDLDGRIEKSRIVAVENNVNSVAFELLGNPAINNDIRFILKNGKSENVTFHDLNGRKLKFNITKTGNILTLKPTASLPTGIYLLGLSNNPGLVKKVLIP